MVNWKTSLGGIMLALGQALAGNADPIMQKVGAVLSAVGGLIVGLAAKDLNVTGGTKQQ